MAQEATLVSNDVEVSWNVNTEADMSHYLVFKTQDKSNWGEPVRVDHPTNFKRFDDLADGQWFFKVDAVDFSGNISPDSDEVFITIDASAPAKPTGLEVIKKK